MIYIRQLPDADELIEKFALTNEQKMNRNKFISTIQNILDGKDSRKLLIIGPCSADREDAVLEYVTRLARLQEEVAERFFVVPRVYTSKPRTNGMGYKGLLHNPNSKNTQENIMSGIIATRKMHLHVVQQTGLFAADEMLYPESIYYTMDLLAYLAVGARSVEDQFHRMAASGMNLPVGLKNPTSGDFATLLNAILAAKYSYHMMYRGWEVQTEGNKYAHAVLRGYVDKGGRMHPNYHYEHLCELYDDYREYNLGNGAVIVDCNHCNSGKNYLEQIRIAKEVLYNCCNNNVLGGFVKGLMLESYIEDGKQLVGGNVYGQSITDSCLGWEKTEKLVKQLAESIK